MKSAVQLMSPSQVVAPASGTAIKSEKSSKYHFVSLKVELSRAFFSDTYKLLREILAFE